MVNQGTSALKEAVQRAIAEYEQFKGERINWLEALGDCLTGLDERLDYTNLLLIRLAALWGYPAPEVPVEPGLYPPVPVVPKPTISPLGVPISKLDDVAITLTTYQTVIEWEVPDLHSGELFEISLQASDYVHASFRLVLASKEQWTDKSLTAPLTLPFSGNRLTQGMLVQIQAKTDNVANPFTAYGSIAGKEYYSE